MFLHHTMIDFDSIDLLLTANLDIKLDLVHQIHEEY